MDSEEIFSAHLAAQYAAKHLASAHDYLAVTRLMGEDEKRTARIWADGQVDTAEKELRELAGYFGFDLVKCEELSKQEAA